MGESLTIFNDLIRRLISSLPLPFSVSDASPDMRCCLLHQKLQMLNCCIKHKLEHQQKLKTSNIKTHSSHTVVSDSHSSPSSANVDIDFHTPISSLREPKKQQSQSSSDDEFYEALEDVPQQAESEHETSGMEISEMDHEFHADEDRTANVAGDSVREGVLKQCGDLVLVATGQPLCIPITQVGGRGIVGGAL